MKLPSPARSSSLVSWLRRSVLAVALAVGAMGPGCGPTERCDEYVAAQCPAGQHNFPEDKSSCLSKYEGTCDSEWGDYVDCWIEDPTCVDDQTNEVHSSACSIKEYAACQCDYENDFGASPWCGLQ